MSATGTIEAIQYKESKAGKAYAKTSIDGAEYLVFGKTLDSLRRAHEGSTVEFSAKPSDNGDGQILTFLKVTGGGVAQGTTNSRPAAVATRAQQRGGSGEHIQLSIFYGYAKDLVMHGILKPSIGSPVAAVDLISTTAKELMRRFEQDAMPDKAEAPKQEVMVGADPQ